MGRQTTTDQVNTAKEESSDDTNENTDTPPGSPSIIPIENPEDQVPMGDPQKSSQKKKRLNQ